MKTVRMVLFWVLLTPGAALAADEQASFRFFKEIDRDAPAEEAILAVTLDADVFAGTEDGFPDLRLLDEAGVEVAYHLETVTQVRTTTVHQTCPSKVVSLQENDDNSIQIHIELEKRAPAAGGLRFVTPLKNYERNVQVFGSRDGQEWKPLVADGLIFDYSRYMDVDNRDVEMPQNDFRRFRVVIADVTDEQESPWTQLTRRLHDDEEAERIESTRIERRDFRVDRIELWREVHKEQVEGYTKTDYPIVEFRAEEDAEKKQTVLHVRARREPLTALKLETATRNFSRRVVVQVPVTRGIRTEWVEVADATLSMIGFRSFGRERLKVTFPQQRQEEYRIIIENEDNRPLEITGVTGEGNTIRAVFFASAGEPYRVYYGSEDAQPPSYDTAAVLATLREGYRPDGGRLGDEVENVAFGEGPGLAIRDILGNRIFLGVAICLMVAVLTWGLYRAGRRIDEVPQEEP